MFFHSVIFSLLVFIFTFILCIDIYLTQCCALLNCSVVCVLWIHCCSSVNLFLNHCVDPGVFLRSHILWFSILCLLFPTMWTYGWWKALWTLFLYSCCLLTDLNHLSYTLHVTLRRFAWFFPWIRQYAGTWKCPIKNCFCSSHYKSFSF